MSYNIIPTLNFEKELKKLSKKYPSLKSDLSEVIESLKEKPVQGDSLFKNCYKIRIAIKSKGKGKSGGSRLITFVKIQNNSVFLLSIYDKSEKESITDLELRYLLRDL